MSSIDNIFPFNNGKKNNKQETPAEGTPTPVMTEMEISLANLEGFLQGHSHLIENFICGITCRDPDNPENGDDVFHLITSPIEAADYALSLHLLQDGLNRRLTLMRDE